MEHVTAPRQSSTTPAPDTARERNTANGTSGAADRRPVDPWSAGRPRGCGDDAERGVRRGEADRRVDEQGPAPRERLREQAAREGSRRAAESAHRPPPPERVIAIRPFGEAGGEDRKPGRRHDGTAETLGSTRGDQRRLVLGEPAGERGEAEQRQPGGEHLTAADQVRAPPADQKKARQRERVGIDHPVQPCCREAEVGPDRRQRDVDDRDVEHADELRRATQDENRDAPCRGERPRGVDVG